METPTAPTPRSARQIEVAGEAVNLVEQGSGPPLLLVHGYPSNALAWSLVMRLLARRYRMLAPDQVGFGRSTRVPTRPLTGDTYADRLADLLDALAIERADIAGLSWGAAVAQRLALRHPGCVRRLVLAAPIHAGHPLRLGDTSLLGALAGRLAPPLARAAVRRYLRRATNGDLPPSELEAVVRAYVEPLALPGTLAFQRRFVRATRRTSAADISRIAAPTLVIVPDADRVVPPAAGQALAAAIPGARLEHFPGVGHAIQYEAATRLAEAIDGFLSG